MSERAYPGERPAEEQSTTDVHLRSSFHHSVEEGEARSSRSTRELIATGLMGGIDVSLGVLAMYVVKELTGSTVAGAIAFSIGFVILIASHSELFTENFLHPVNAWVTRRVSAPAVLRLWGGTLTFNLIGGWLFAWLIALALPTVHVTAIDLGASFVERSNAELIALGLMAGMAITLMTWLEETARSSDFSRTAAVIGIGFVFIAAHLNHVIVVSIEMFVALHTGGASFGYAGWGRVAGIALVTNVVGGVVLVTGLRLLQVGRHQIEKERRREAAHIVRPSPPL